MTWSEQTVTSAEQFSLEAPILQILTAWDEIFQQYNFLKLNFLFICFKF